MVQCVVNGSQAVECSYSTYSTMCVETELALSLSLSLSPTPRPLVMWQGHLMLKNESAAVQLHFLSGNVSLAKLSLPQPSEQHTPCLRIAQRMRLEQTQLEACTGGYRCVCV